MAKDMDEARIWWENLTKQMHPVPAITNQGLDDIATLLDMKKVGRWDDLMNDAQFRAVTDEPSKLNDVAALIASWELHLQESRKFVTPPTNADELKSLYRLASQIFKTLRVEMDAAKENTDAVS